MQYSEKILVVSSSIKKRLLKKSITDKLSELASSKEKVLWDNVASEFKLNQSFSNKDLNKLRLQFKGTNIDLNLIENNQNYNRRKKLLVADMDSTILTSETLDDLANLIGKKYEIEKITNDAMQGKINFASSLLKRVKALGKTNTDYLDKLSQLISKKGGTKINIKVNIESKKLIFELENKRKIDKETLKIIKKEPYLKRISY